MLYYILLVLGICLMLYGLIGMKTGKVGQTTICVFRDNLTHKNKAYRIKKEDIHNFNLDDNSIKLLNYYNSLSIADKLLLLGKLEIDYINKFKEENGRLTNIE